MKIKIDNLVFEFHFICEFPEFNKYETEDDPDYIVDFSIGEVKRPNIEPLYINKTYEAYDNIDIYTEDNILKGSATYNGKNISVILYAKDRPLEYMFANYVVRHELYKMGNYLFMHGSSILYNGKGIIFTAKSGVGKSTHVKMWTDNTSAINVNDDKNILKLIDDKLYLIPNPFSGKHHRDNNVSVELKTIVFVKRGEINKIYPENKKVALKLLLMQLDHLTQENSEVWNNILTKLLSLNTYGLECTKDLEALNVCKGMIDNEAN